MFVKTPCIIGDHMYLDSCQDTADMELIPEREDTQPDSPLEDTVSVTLKRENSIRRSQRSNRLEHWGHTIDNRQLVCACACVCLGVSE